MSAEFLEPVLVDVLGRVRLVIEVLGALVIIAGVAVAGRRLFAHYSAGGESFGEVRLLLARYLALGLEFQLAADILSTAISPGWDALGKLAAIAAIRTVLNWFLQQEMQREGAARPPA